MSDINNNANVTEQEEKEKTVHNFKRNDFGWESLASVEESRQNQLISEVYSIMNTGDDAKLEFIKKEWNSLSEEGIDPALEERFTQAIHRYETRQERLEEAISAKKNLIQKAESIKNSTDWNITAAELQELQKEWKEAGFAGQELDQELWEKFRAINDYFFDRRSEYYDNLSVAREEAKGVKEALIEKIEKLKDSTDWKKTSVEIRDLMTEWKQAGFAGREHEDNLWERFNEARQYFYQKQREYFDGMRQLHDKARSLKLSIIDRAEKLLKDFNELTTRESMEDLFTEWKEAGHSGRDNEEKLWSQFRAIQDDFYAMIKDRGNRQRQEKLENAQAELDTLQVRMNALNSLNEKLELKISNLQNQYDLYQNETVLEELNGLKENLAENKVKLVEYQEQYDSYNSVLTNN